MGKDQALLVNYFEFKLAVAVVAVPDFILLSCIDAILGVNHRPRFDPKHGSLVEIQSRLFR